VCLISRFSSSLASTIILGRNELAASSSSHPGAANRLLPTIENEVAIGAPALSIM
jgi:hypothetical protein